MICSSFYKEVQSIPLIFSAEDFYAKSRSGILSTGLAIVVDGISIIWGKYIVGSSVAALVDSLAGEGVAKPKEKFPSLSKFPDKIKQDVSFALKQTVRDVMETVPGKTVMVGLDCLLEKSESVLKYIMKSDEGPSQSKTETESAKLGVSYEQDSNSKEDIGVQTVKEEIPVMDTSQQTYLSGIQEQNNYPGVMKWLFDIGIAYPLSLLVRGLKTIRHYVGGSRRIAITIKEKEISTRRKVSPRKKVTGTFLGRVKHRTLRFLGLKQVYAIDMTSFHDGVSSERAETEKRKHHEIETESSEEEFLNFDFDNYDSETDSDYDPLNKSNSTEETEATLTDDDFESEIETEIVEKHANGVVLLQLKDKDSDAQPSTESPSSPDISVMTEESTKSYIEGETELTGFDVQAKIELTEVDVQEKTELTKDDIQVKTELTKDDIQVKTELTKDDIQVKTELTEDANANGGNSHE